MLGDLLTRVLVLTFGYAYPAFECFKTLEKNKVSIEELRFWCQYWILAAVITVLESFVGVLISWLPMYGEAKLALYIYLWYPKTMGCGYIYDSIVRPYISKHEPDIDRSIQELKARGMDFVIFYWQNFAVLAQSKFFEILQFVASQSANMTTRSKSEDVDNKVNDGNNATSSYSLPPSPPSTPSSHFKKTLRQFSENSRQMSSRKIGRPPVPPSSPTAHGLVSQSPKATRTQIHLQDVARTIDEDNEKSLNDMVDQNGVDHTLQSPTLKKRSKSSIK